MKLSNHRKKCIESEVASWPIWKQQFYEEMVDDGQSVSMAHMLACQEAPRSLTDAVVMSGQRKIKDLPDARREYLCKEIKKNGGNVTPSSVYMQGMANFTGDPNAVFAHGDMLSKIRENARMNGSQTEGIISFDGRGEMKQAEKVYALHPRIVERKRQQLIAADPSVAHKDQNEVREAIIDKHSFKGK